MHHAGAEQQQSSLGAILALTFLASMGTGVLWSGLSFIAKHEFDYSAEANFLLYIATAVAYVAAALAAGKVTRALERHLSPRGILAWLLVAQAMIALLPLVWAAHWVLWVVGCSTSMIAATLWPIVESYLGAGRHGRAMRSAMGWWNVTWTVAVALALVLMAPLISKQYAVMAVVALAPISILAIPILLGFTHAPGVHDESMQRESITIEYPLLLRSARVLLPLGYLLIGAISPLMPYRLEELGVEAISETPMTATWMFARVAALAIMWRVQFWHGRWGTLLFGAGMIIGGFGLIVAAVNVPMLLLGLISFGIGQGVIYYAALYYALSVGAAAVDAGGTHEALIGVGYAVGPAAALAGLRLSVLLGLGWTGGTGIVITVTTLTLMAAVPAFQPYRIACKRRQAAQVRAMNEKDPLGDEGAFGLKTDK